MKSFLFLSRVILLLLIFQIFSGSITAQLTVPDESSSLFQSSETLRLTLTMDVREVLGDIGEERIQHPAEISYISEDTEIVSVPLQVRTRGHFRRDPMNCDFPPLRFNFAAENSENSIFEGQDKIKLVTHCRSRGDQHEQNLLKEYLAYRLYNLFSEESFRVRLVELRYVDSGGRKDTLNKMAFLLEPTWQLCERNQSSLVEVKNVQQDQCREEKATTMSIFQYMIGNTDWSVPVPHNIVLIQKQPGVPPVAVPYDFDWCGLVNAPYARPAENLDIDDVRTRIFRGCCRSAEEYEKAFQQFRDKEEEVFQTIRSVPGLSKKEIERQVKYIERFYQVLDNPKLIKKEFYDKCRQD